MSLGCRFFEATDEYSGLSEYVDCKCEDGNTTVGVSYPFENGF